MATMTKEEAERLKNIYMNAALQGTSITSTSSSSNTFQNISPGGYSIATKLGRDWYSNIQDDAAVTYRHTSHAPESVYKTLESFGWIRHQQHGSDAELFTHKDHNGACLYWYEALIAQMSLAFIELNK